MLGGRVPVVVEGFGIDLGSSEEFFLSVLLMFNGLGMFEGMVDSASRRARGPSMGLDGIPDPDLRESMLSKLKMKDVSQSPWFAQSRYISRDQGQGIIIFVQNKKEKKQIGRRVRQ